MWDEEAHCRHNRRVSFLKKSLAWEGINIVMVSSSRLEHESNTRQQLLRGTNLVVIVNNCAFINAEILQKTRKCRRLLVSLEVVRLNQTAKSNFSYASILVIS